MISTLALLPLLGSRGAPVAAGESVPVLRRSALVVTARVTYDPHGVCEVRIRDRAGSRAIRIPHRKDEMYETDSPRFQPILTVARDIRDGRYLCVAVPMESGVYGYRRLAIYGPFSTGRKATVRLIKTIEFSDFGSWYATPRGALVTWDADRTLGAHVAPHPYIVQRFSLGERMRLLSKVSTRRSYYPGDGDFSNRPAHVLRANDPVRELGLRWRWWGKG